MEKAHIIDALGEGPLLLPALLNGALAANDRAKYFFTLLQTAQGHADRPDGAAPALRIERQAAGIDDEALDGIVAESRRGEGNLYRIPRVQGICTALYQDLQRMLEPIQAAGSPEWGGFAARLKLLAARPWCQADDLVSGEQIAAMTSGERERADSLHLLVMDLHKGLNALQARIATETIDGAQAYDIAAADRALIGAFMRGINQTRPLKFDHPGLGTTATRAGDRLVLQNDIGTTDAHVLVVHVEGLRAQLIYTDVHMQRLLFFQSLFEGWRVGWEDTRSRADHAMEDGVYHLCTGTYAARKAKELEDYLAFLGSRLVFLIDWNRARKRLRQLLPKKESLALLKWAADHNHGHMAFLRAGGEQMVFEALAFAARAPLPPGARLDSVLGREAAAEFMRFVFRACAEGLLAAKPEEFIQDEVRAELTNYIHSTQQGLVDLAAEQAAFAIEIACGVRDCLLEGRGEAAAARFVRNAERAKHWEHQADELVNRARNAAGQSGRSDFFRGLIESADDVVDELEEAAFHLTLLPHDGGDGELYGPLNALARLLVDGSQEYLRALETLRTLRRGGPREDMQDFLEAIHRIMVVERQSDGAQRSVKLALARETADFRRLYAFAECARNLEAAADALMHAGLRLRDQVLASAVAE
ncbi:MAG: DUF47 family protein [Rhodocyclaceae bacterium]|jgi:uncharacterized protein Yka (UPF0111/DUF47 family)|nr:hypothetical protein [Rhodocyclaceae bacterium]MCC6878702.1 DUF47 family protein [Rhodocyclaceae bacterium]MCL4680772.1 DUF47 family protein [Rhodocyclaceae bacterium]